MQVIKFFQGFKVCHLYNTLPLKMCISDITYHHFFAIAHTVHLSPKAIFYGPLIQIQNLVISILVATIQQIIKNISATEGKANTEPVPQSNCNIINHLSVLCTLCSDKLFFFFDNDLLNNYLNNNNFTYLIHGISS